MNIMTLEEEKFKDVTVSGYNFRIRFMTPLDRANITNNRVAMQNGNPIEAYTQDEFSFLENIAIVNTCTDQMPKEFKKNESCVKWLDINLINELAYEIRQHTSDIEELLKKNRPTVGIGEK